MTIRLVLVDDHPIVLNGLVSLFAVERDVEVLACALDGRTGLQAVRQLRPDIVVLDLLMRDMDGLTVLREMKRDGLPTRAVVLTAMEGEDVVESVRLGACGVVLKDMAVDLLVRCVREVYAGRQWLEKSVATKALGNLLKREEGVRVMAATLTPREIQVARMVTEGLPSKAVAGRLAISEGTAKLHLHHVYQKLKLDGRMALMRYIASNGLG